MATNYVLVSSSASCDSSSDDETVNPKKIDFSYQGLVSEVLEVNLIEMSESTEKDQIEKILLYNNSLDSMANALTSFRNISVLDLSNNLIRELPENLNTMVNLTQLFLRNNLLDDLSFPKTMSSMVRLRDLNLSGNRLTTIPSPVLGVVSLRNLFLGGNRLTEIPRGIKNLKRLRVFYLGGNQIRALPSEICQLANLHALILCDNQLESLPECICCLKRLECLQLHQNRLTTLPEGLIRLKSLSELSLRDNPLVVRFIREMTYQPSSLLELTARVIITNRIDYQPDDLPHTLHGFLHSSHQCVNPKCQGVYFNTRVEHVKFVDFCGKYKIPLLQYLCSPLCKADDPAVARSSQNLEEETNIMKRVLLG